MTNRKRDWIPRSATPFDAHRRIAPVPSFAAKCVSDERARRVIRRVGFVAALVCCAATLWFLLFPAFRAEQRTVSKDGAAQYSSMVINRLDLDDWLEGLRLNGHPNWVVRSVIYDESAVYIFTFGGHV